MKREQRESNEQFDRLWEDIKEDIQAENGNGNGQDIDKKPLNKFALKYSYQPKYPDASLTIEGYNILNVGELGCLLGLPGSGKSAIVEAFIVAHLVSYHKLKDIDTNGIESKSFDRGVGLLDTEQTPDANRIEMTHIEQALDIADKRPELIDKENDKIKGLDYYMMAEVGSRELLFEYLEEIFETDISLLIIDGILDLVKSMNNEENTKEVIQGIRSMAIKKNITVLFTLHPNKNTDVMAGHLGSNIYRWARACLIVQSCKHDKSVKELTTGFSMGKLSHANAFEFPGIFFRWSNAEKRMVSADKPDAASYDIDAINQVFSGWKISNSTNKIPSKDFKERYSKIIGKGSGTVRVHVAEALKKGCFESEGEGPNTVYFKNINDEELPF